MEGTPSLNKVIDDAIESRLSEVHSCMPARVVRVDNSKAQCDVQPLLKRRYADETVVNLPVVTNVPLAFYRAGPAFISLPVKVGSTVMLLFSERSLDLWLSKGGEIDPLDPRKHDLSDAIAYPGVYPFSDPPEGANADDIVIKNGVATLIIKPTALELYGNGDAIALASKVMTELNKIRTAFNGHTHPYLNGASPATTSASASSVSAIAEVKSVKVKAE